MHPHTDLKVSKLGSPADVIVLCGGLGTRLLPIISDRPKSLAPMGQWTFLDLLLDYIARQGFSRIILAVGHKAEMIQDHVRGRTPELLLSVEQRPLGTGGAVKQAWPLTESTHVMIMNGDTFCPVDLQDVVRFHVASEGHVTVVVTRATRPDGGSIALDDHRLITRFAEKENMAASYISAGIYVLRTDVPVHFPERSVFSLEHDVFPSLLTTMPCYGYVTDHEAVDIGTPQRYEQAIKTLG